MPFSNPIVGGDGELIRDNIRSENYVQGSAGWRIAKDGEAEFSEAVVRGEFQAGPVTVTDSGIRVNDTGGGGYATITTDDNGEGSGAIVGLNFGAPEFFPGQFSGSAELRAQQFGDFSTDPTGMYAPLLTITSPYVDQYPNPPGGANNASSIILAGADEEGRPAYIDLNDNGGGVNINRGPLRVERKRITHGIRNNPIPEIQAGVFTFNQPTAAGSHTQTVTFPVPWPAGTVPIIPAVNMATTAGTTALMMVRASAITNTGFALSVLRTDGAAGTFTLANVNVHWMAIAYPTDAQ